MNKTKRRIILSLTGLLFTGAVSWWCLWFPYNEGEDLRRALPANAVLISKHDRLAERYVPFLSNSMVRAVLVSFGVDAKDIDDVIEDKSSGGIIKMFGSRKTYLAYIPRCPGSDHSAWVITSWSGGWGQMLRWGFLSSLLKDFEQKRMDGGLKYWVLKNDDEEAPVLALTSVRGVLLGCYSRDVSMLQHMVSLIELKVPVYDHGMHSLDMSSVPDAGCYKHAAISGGELKVDEIRFSAVIAGESLDMNIRGDTTLDGSRKLSSYPDLSRVDDILTARPDSVAVFPHRYFDGFLNSRSVPRNLRVTSRLIGTALSTNSPMFLAVYGGQMNGRLLGVKVPTIIAGARVHENFNLTNWISGTVDSLNMYLKTAVIAKPIHKDTFDIITIESTREDIYSSVKEEERPAMALKDGWLVICSNRRTMEVLLNGKAAQREVAGLLSVDSASSAAAYIDLNKSSESLKNLIAVVLLVQMSQGLQADGKASEYMRMTQDALKGLAPMHDLSLSVSINSGSYSADIKAGRKSAL